jgi:dsDNA-binding SOS-regulon protein
MESRADGSTEKRHKHGPPSNEAYEKAFTMFKQLDVNKSSSPMTAEEQANNLSFFLADLRPGEGLIGNKQEEDHLYEKLQENTREAEQGVSLRRLCSSSFPCFRQH